MSGDQCLTLSFPKWKFNHKIPLLFYQCKLGIKLRIHHLDTRDTTMSSADNKTMGSLDLVLDLDLNPLSLCGSKVSGLDFVGLFLKLDRGQICVCVDVG